MKGIVCRHSLLAPMKITADIKERAVERNDVPGIC